MSPDHPQESNDTEIPKSEQNDLPTGLHLSTIERQILELHDRLEELRLEISYLQSQSSQSVPDVPTEVTDQEIEASQAGLLDAKAHYTLRNNIIESVLISNPILKTVHASLSASTIERDLLPLIQERDDLSVSLTERSSKVLATTEELVKLEVEHIKRAQRNKELAAIMMGLAEEANTQRNADVTDPEMRQEIEALQEALKISRQRWRIMKGTVSAVVAGSGIDWARDRVLRELVIDDEDEDS